MLSQLGNFFIALGLSASFLQISYFFLTKLYKNLPNIITAFSIIHFFSMSFAFLILIYAFVISDFTVQNVWENSHTLKPLIYKISGSWGSHEGSMLLWCWVIALYGLLISFNYQLLKEKNKSLILIFQGFLSLGFTAYLFFLSNPLQSNITPSNEGNGLNPLLQDPGLAMHPPFLYLGYVGLSIVWSFALSGLVMGKIDEEWAKNVKFWALISWVFLTIGISLGSWWAYYELGWGGYWFWDPVENVSLIPWIITTALLHNLMALERKNILVNWSVLLSLLAFILSIIGTFIVRSGLITSVHAFASDPTRGIFILALLTIYTVMSLMIYARNFKIIENNSQLNFFSKEVFIIVNNLLLSVIAFTIFLGTLYPLLIEVLNDERISVGPPFYNITVIPFALLLSAFAAVGPSLAWHTNDVMRVLKRLIVPSILTLILVSSFFYFNFVGSTLFIIGFVLSIWIIMNSMQNIALSRFRGLSNWSTAIAHSGFAVLILGVTFSSVFQKEFENILDIETKINFSGYELTFDNIDEKVEDNYISTFGKFTIIKSGKVNELFPEKRFYPIEQSHTTEAAIITNNLSQIYLVLGEKINEKSWVVRVWYKPMILLIWIGGIMMAIAGLLSFFRHFKMEKSLKLFLLICFLAFTSSISAKSLDSGLEERIHSINLQIRCMVCQSQTIDDSDAPLAKDLRELVRKKVIEGKTDDEIFDYLSSRYGDYILMKPPVQLSTYFLWFAPLGFFIFGIFIIFKIFNIRFRDN
jgi:cytochrome c-type biogenesis protein CcmF